MKPTIGIIGGSGPLATLDIEKKILDFNKKLIGPLLDQDYFNIICLNNSDINDRNDSVAFGSTTPLTQYLKLIHLITSLDVDFILIACNTAHMYLSLLQQQTMTPIVSIVEETATRLGKTLPAHSPVGLIATQTTKEKKLYHQALFQYDIHIIDVSDETQISLMQAIYLIKSGISLNEQSETLDNPNLNRLIIPSKKAALANHPYKKILLQKSLPNPVVLVSKAIQELTTQGCHAVIFGCTELPMVIPYLSPQDNVTFVDPNLIIAESIIKRLSDIERQSEHPLNIINNEKRYI